MEQKQAWLETAIVREHIQRAFDAVSSYHGRVFVDSWRYCLDPAYHKPYDEPWPESPLEVIWMIWWAVYREQNSIYGEKFALSPQVPVSCGGEDYRLDFVVGLEDMDALERFTKAGIAWPLIGVEVDGHAFHEKTRDQVTYRNKRDRGLQAAGWKVFHYSFSEVTGKPMDCVSEVFAFARATYEAISVEAGRRLMTPEQAADIDRMLEKIQAQNRAEG